MLTRLRRELNTVVYTDSASGTSVFTYDNDSFILYQYVTSTAQPDSIHIHIKGKAEKLFLPVQKKTLSPLYAKADETVFEARTMPGEYVLYQIVR